MRRVLASCWRRLYLAPHAGRQLIPFELALVALPVVIVIEEKKRIDEQIRPIPLAFQVLPPCVRREALISPPAQESVDELIKGDEHLLQIAPHHFAEKSTGWKAISMPSSSSFVLAFSIASRSFHFSWYAALPEAMISSWSVLSCSRLT